jgi:TorA maturation chaperone TorD
MNAAGAWAEGRGQLYRFLAAAFLRPPAAGLVAPFLDCEILTELGDRFGEDAVADLRRFKESFGGDYGSLDQEYQDLFVVPLGRYVTPYEAVYRDERMLEGERVRGLLMGPSTLAVKALYRNAGVEVAADVLELPDHVGLELGCMQSLCEAEARAWEGADAEGAERAGELQRRLLEEHLLQWVPALCARVRENAPGPFYRGIAALTEAFLRHEAEVAEKPETDRRAECGRG